MTALENEKIHESLLSQWETLNDKLYTLAAEFPENKYGYRPHAEARSFEEVIRHVAFWNRYAAESATGKSPNGDANELSKSEYATKAKALKALKATAAEVAKALASQPGAANLTDVLVPFLGHNCEHYGQLVAYYRMNGLVPPASRG